MQLDEYRYKNASIAMAFAIAWDEEDRECYVRVAVELPLSLQAEMATEIPRLRERLKAATGQPSAE
jgi:hypothetical protein